MGNSQDLDKSEVVTWIVKNLSIEEVENILEIMKFGEISIDDSENKMLEELALDVIDDSDPYEVILMISDSVFLKREAKKRWKLKTPELYDHLQANFSNKIIGEMEFKEFVKFYVVNPDKKNRIDPEQVIELLDNNKRSRRKKNNFRKFN